jgi:hypothetical protein
LIQNLAFTCDPITKCQHEAFVLRLLTLATGQPICKLAGADVGDKSLNVEASAMKVAFDFITGAGGKNVELIQGAGGQSGQGIIDHLRGEIGSGMATAKEKEIMPPSARAPQAMPSRRKRRRFIGLLPSLSANRRLEQTRFSAHPDCHS